MRHPAGLVKQKTVLFEPKVDSHNVAGLVPALDHGALLPLVWLPHAPVPESEHRKGL